MRKAAAIGLIVLSGFFTGGKSLAADVAPIGAAATSVATKDTANPSPVGFEVVHIPNGSEAPLVAGVWYPTTGEPHDVPLEDFKQRVVPSGSGRGPCAAAYRDLAWRRRILRRPL
ncbi:hypothetical protein [Mesorhizobium hawassense]|uniref:hypothetical protein n=1 Tax=Mesorhizobium hawassense TaxID=1209954 RepID=UPI001FE17640|nr:hypothetical protein [Mesorhizobium hawassense]